jgi:hypothetical protein
LQSGADFFVLLTTGGDVYTFGAAGADGALGQGDGAFSSYPRKILSGIHSIGVGPHNSWAVAGPKWISQRYRPGVDAGPLGTRRGVKAGVLFWGGNQDSDGAPSGDPVMMATAYWTPTQLSASSMLNRLFEAGQMAGHDNVTPGVVAGSVADGGTFQQLTGHLYGSQALIRDGSVYTWGHSTFSGSGHADVSIYRRQMIPERLNLRGARATAVVHTLRVVLVLDSTGAVWTYGYGGASEGAAFPKADGRPPMSRHTRTPVRIAGNASPGWAAGGVSGITSPGNATAMVIRKDRSVWLVGGGAQVDVSANRWSLVRNSWTKTGNTIPTNASRPITWFNVATLPQ